MLGSRSCAESFWPLTLASLICCCTHWLVMNRAVTACCDACVLVSHAGDLVCGTYTDKVLEEDVCLDPAADFSCDVKQCDFEDLAGNCYRYRNIPANFVTAESTCLARGGHLAYNPDTRVVTQMLAHAASLQTVPSLVWIGLRSKSLCVFTGVDGSLETGSTNWNSGEPNMCSALSNGGCGSTWATTAVRSRAA